MGFKFWYEGFIFIFLFLGAVGIPCFFAALIGSKMINDLGNTPTQAAKIQTDATWKILIVEVLAFVALAALFQFFS